jgi:uncharacterized protein (TIGR02246 family)
MMSRILPALTLCSAIVLGGCGGTSATAKVDPSDPTITATVDSLLGVALDGAARADADRALQVVADSGEVTLLVGNVMFTDLDKIRSGFRETYAGLERQDQTLLEKRIRVISPDVAIATIIGEGTYTDKAGWTSEPVDIATTLVFVKENAGWRVRHAQQSITR